MSIWLLGTAGNKQIFTLFLKKILLLKTYPWYENKVTKFNKTDGVTEARSKTRKFYARYNSKWWHYNACNKVECMNIVNKFKNLSGVGYESKK